MGSRCVVAGLCAMLAAVTKDHMTLAIVNHKKRWDLGEHKTDGVGTKSLDARARALARARARARARPGGEACVGVIRVPQLVFRVQKKRPGPARGWGGAAEA